MTFFKVNDYNFRFSQKGNYMVTSLEVDRKGVFILRKNVAIQNEMTATATLGWISRPMVKCWKTPKDFFADVIVKGQF